MPDKLWLNRPMPSRRAGEPASRTYMWGVLLLYVLISVATIPNLQLQKADPKSRCRLRKKEISHARKCFDG